MVWEARKPIYRNLARFSDRFFLHANKEQQRLNELESNKKLKLSNLKLVFMLLAGGRTKSCSWGYENYKNNVLGAQNIL